jgi:hypothetical protein
MQIGRQIAVAVPSMRSNVFLGESGPTIGHRVANAGIAVSEK